jgi:hypothetical protein
MPRQPIFFRVSYWLCLVVSLSIESTIALPQHPRVVIPEEREGTPTVAAEPHNRSIADPNTIFHNLLSPSEHGRQLALQQLSVGATEFEGHAPEVTDARLIWTNLDKNHELEAVVMYTDSRRATHAFVFAKQQNEWWQIGNFHYRWHWNSESAEHFVEFREIVWPGRKDLIVREASGGTDVVQTELRIYRMYGGLLYRVFTILEEKDVNAYLESNRLSYYDSDAAEPPSIVVRHVKIAHHADDAEGPADVATCSGYAWDAGKFAFLPSKTIRSKTQ